MQTTDLISHWAAATRQGLGRIVAILDLHYLQQFAILGTWMIVEGEVESGKSGTIGSARSGGVWQIGDRSTPRWAQR